MKETLVCVGTRPEWLKVQPLLPHIKHKLFFTGQQQDLIQGVGFDFTAAPLSRCHDRLGNVITSCLEGFPEWGYDYVLVQGDTASAFACALAAFHRQKKVLYLESGLRSFDLKNPFPEEGYRQMISRIADVHFCPTKDASVNLIEEGVGNQQLDNIHVVGNTVLDNLVGIKPSYRPQILVTLHRRENLPIIREWFRAVNGLAADYPEIRFVLPMHPNPEIQQHKLLLSHVEVVDPMPHNELVDFMKDCTLLITDSGGLQEEGAFLDKKVLVCRKTTERPEGIKSGHTVMCEDPETLRNKFPETLLSYKINEPCPYGDGKSGERIGEIINELQ